MIFKLFSLAPRGFWGRFSSQPHKLHDQFLLDMKIIPPGAWGSCSCNDHPKGIGIVGGNFNELDDQLHVPSHLLLVLTHPCHVVISIYSSHEFSVLWCHFWTLKLDLPMECATFLLCPVLDNLHRFCCRMNERQKIDSFGVLPDSGNQFMELPP